MKVSELKAGMLLRFKEPRPYKFLRDSGDDHWLECGNMNPNTRVVDLEIGQPLIIYLGREKMPDPSHYGGFYHVRKISIEGRICWMWPEAWKHLEAL